jgi:hypothetical protein
MMKKWLLPIALVLPLIAGCAGLQGPTTGHAVGYIYAENDTATAQATPAPLQLFASIAADPDLNPITGAQITLVELNRSTVTSVDGSYGIFNVEPGTYTLRATHPGYEGQEWTITIRAGYTTFGDTFLRNNVNTPVYYDDYNDYYWWWDDDDDDWGFWEGGGGYVPEPPPTDDTIDDGGGISLSAEE